MTQSQGSKRLRNGPISHFRHLGVRGKLVPPDHRLQRGAQRGEYPIAFNPPQARLDIEQSCGGPPLLLGTIGLPVDIGGPLVDQGKERFRAVTGVPADPEGSEDAQDDSA